MPAVAKEYLEGLGYGDDVYFGPDVVSTELIQDFNKVIGGAPVPLQVTVHKRFRVAVILLGLDLSDAWYCGIVGFESRLPELGIEADITYMGTTGGDHIQQAAHIDTAIAQKFHYVIIAPTELFVQKAGIQRMIQAGIKVIVWNYTDPIKDWGLERYPDGMQPLAYVGFSDIVGGVMMGEHANSRLEPGSTVALIQGVPGYLSQCRVGIPGAIMALGGQEIIYEHFCDYDKTKAYETTKSVLAAYPDVDHIYSCNTAQTYGIIAALTEQGKDPGEILVNGWGGGWGEQKHMWEGYMGYSIMRMQDDWGVALAEVMKYDIEGRMDEVPLCVIGGIVLIHDGMTQEEVAVYSQYAYRYSGVVEY